MCVNAVILHGVRKHMVGTRLKETFGIASPAAPPRVGSQRMTLIKRVLGFAVRAKQHPQQPQSRGPTLLHRLVPKLQLALLRMFGIMMRRVLTILFCVALARNL